RFRQQGSVSVAFKVQKNGRINDMRVASSSNSMILDKAALQTVQRVSTLFPLPEELNRAEWAFIIPINYNLH
ncbi:MAG: energy transducer TonB, partial [Gammaproteobacteria bacterium]|nr:energy transducer TonB [Gammaproteobacteria bacterium]